MNSITEQQASQRWCPFARSYGYPSDEADASAVTVNRSRKGGPDRWCQCLASGCMAWRWDKTVLGVQSGHCGLAGGVEP
jgi:hypothetical protein